MCKKAPTKKTRTRLKIICITIAAVLIAVIGYFSVPSFWFWICWVFVGAGLVAIGCIGEWVLFIKPLPDDSDDWLKSHHRRRELQFITAVAIGVTMDFIGLFHEIPQALQLEKDVVLIGSTNAQLVTANLALQKEMQPRRITMEQRTNFMSLAQFIPKIPIKILIGKEGFDTEDFAIDIREMLNLAEFKINPDAGIWGINRDETLIERRFLWNTNYGIEFVAYGTNEVTYHFTPQMGHIANGVSKPINVGTNEIEVYGAIAACFQKIGIDVQWQSDSKNVKPGEWLIFVPVK